MFGLPEQKVEARRQHLKTLFTLGAAVAACGAMIVAQQTRAQQRPTGPYTFEQALAGREAYLANCAACHATDLSGREGPQLAGGTFMNQWGDRTARELISFMRASMPPGAGGSLPDQSYVNLAAFILDANGARPGDRGLSSESEVLIRTVASGQPAPTGAPWTHGGWPSQELRFGHRRHAAQSRSRRLAHDSTRL